MTDMHPDQMEPLLLENVRLVFCNFEGRKGPYNPEGAANFCAILEDKEAEKLLEEGWNVKVIRGPGERDSYLPITLFKNAYVRKLDTTKRCNVKVLGYRWNIGNKTGVKAYLEHIEEAPDGE
jgi:hypothetical protein